MPIGVLTERISNLPIRLSKCWWRWPASNRRPPACKAGALPTELHPRWTMRSRSPAVISAPAERAPPSACDREVAGGDQTLSGLKSEKGRAWCPGCLDCLEMHSCAGHRSRDRADFHRALRRLPGPASGPAWDAVGNLIFSPRRGYSSAPSGVHCCAL